MLQQIDQQGSQLIQIDIKSSKNQYQTRISLYQQVEGFGCSNFKLWLKNQNERMLILLSRSNMSTIRPRIRLATFNKNEITLYLVSDNQFLLACRYSKKIQKNKASEFMYQQYCINAFKNASNGTCSKKILYENQKKQKTFFQQIDYTYYKFLLINTYFIQKMFEEESIWDVIQLQLKTEKQKNLNLKTNEFIYDNMQVTEKKQNPWQCPQCKQRFKWDIQLLRHQRKTNHVNTDRLQRKQKRYKKVIHKKIRCSLCQTQFDRPSERIQHQCWCIHNQKTLKLRQSYLCRLSDDIQKSLGKKFVYECSQHEVPFYFTTLEMLKQHIKTHKKLDSEKVRQVMQIFKQIKKERPTLSKQEYLRITQKFKLNVAVSTLIKWSMKIQAS